MRTFASGRSRFCGANITQMVLNEYAEGPSSGYVLLPHAKIWRASWGSSNLSRRRHAVIGVGELLIVFILLGGLLLLTAIVILAVISARRRRSELPGGGAPPPKLPGAGA